MPTMKNQNNRISFFCEMRILETYFNTVKEALHNKFIATKDVEEEIFDEDGDFIELYNDKLEKQILLETLLMKSIFYELNTIREHYYNAVLIDYVFKIVKNSNKEQESYCDIIKRIKSENIQNIRDNYKGLIKSKSDTIFNRTLIELALIFGGFENIPKEILQHKKFKRNSDLIKTNVCEFNKKYDIKNLKNYNEFNQIRLITNSYKHNRSFKDIKDSDWKSPNEQYDLSIKDVDKYFKGLESFFEDLFQKTDYVIE